MYKTNTLSKELVSDLSAPYKRSLVGKFSQGRPMLEDIHSYFVSLDLKAQFQIGLLDARHIIINFQCDEDFHRIYSRMIWYIGDSVMRILKWSINFHVDKESPIVPVWIELEKLPIFLFQKDVLFTIVSTVGHPLRLDAATTALRKPSVARIQVEVNLLKELPDSIWIGLGDEEGFWQKIKYCNIPSYCSFCWHVGHDLDHCHVKNPALKQTSTESFEPVKEAKPMTKKWNQVYRVKENDNTIEKELDAPDKEKLEYSEPFSMEEKAQNTKKNQEGPNNSPRVVMFQPEHQIEPMESQTLDVPEKGLGPLDQLSAHPISNRALLDSKSLAVDTSNKFPILQEELELVVDPGTQDVINTQRHQMSYTKKLQTRSFIQNQRILLILNLKMTWMLGHVKNNSQQFLEVVLISDIDSKAEKLTQGSEED